MATKAASDRASSRDRGSFPLKYIVGLGNPGRKYAGSRHNIGFDVVERFAEREFFEGERRKFQAFYREKVLALGGGSEKVYLLRPQTYMNLSGNAVRDFLGFFGESVREPLVDKLLVVYDDIDLPTGRLRFRAKGSAGGHNGLKSVISCLGHQNFSRLKIGVGRRPGIDAADFVLAKVDSASREVLDRAVDQACQSLEVWLRHGIEESMNRFNRVEDDAADET